MDSIVRLQLSAQIYSQVASCILILLWPKIKKITASSPDPRPAETQPKVSCFPKKTKLAQPSRHISAKLIFYPAGRLPHVAVPILPTPHCLPRRQCSVCGGDLNTTKSKIQSQMSIIPHTGSPSTMASRYHVRHQSGVTWSLFPDIPPHNHRRFLSSSLSLRLLLLLGRGPVVLYPFQVEGRFLLDVVVSQGAAIFQLLSREDQTLLIRRDTFLVLDLLHNVFDRVRAVDIEIVLSVRVLTKICIDMVCSSSCAPRIYEFEFLEGMNR